MTKYSSKFTNEKLQKTFKQVDENNDGQIGFKSFKAALFKLGQHFEESDLERFLKRSGIETDSPTDDISFEKFINLVEKFSSEKQHEQDLTKAFEEFDGEKKGYIDASGIKRVLKHLKIDFTSEEIELMMEVADTNGDGRVDLDEFLQIFK